MKVLVTGSNGFIGSWLVEKLLGKGCRVKCLVRATSDLRWLQGLSVTFCYADLRKPVSMNGILADVDLVYHLAGVTKAKSREDMIAGNVDATKNLLEACEKYGPGHLKFVYVSSQAAGGPSTGDRPVTEEDEVQPISLYGESKLLAEKAVMTFHGIRPVSVVRPPSVYGPRDRDIFKYFQNIQKGILLILGNGEQKLSLIHVNDLVDGIILAGMSRAADGRLYYITGDGAFDWLTIGQSIAAALDRRSITIKVPFWLLDAASYLNIAISKLAGKPALLNRDKVREMKQMSWLCSSRRAKEELGFTPKIDLEKGIADTAKWYREMKWL